MGGWEIFPTQKIIPVTSIELKLHKDAIKNVLEIYFPKIFKHNQNYE